MKVVFCLNSFLPQFTGGTEIYTFSLIRHLQRENMECIVIVPNFSADVTEHYDTGGVRVIKYAESSVMDKKLAMGLKEPAGLGEFKNILSSESPDIIHFMEYSGSNGISIHHVRLARQMGIKTLMTFHLAGYTCRTGTLMYLGKDTCSGIIDEVTCARCISRARGVKGASLDLLSGMSGLLFKSGINVSRIGVKLTTALGLPFLVRKFKDDFHTLIGHCDRLIVLSDWYCDVLVKNKVPVDKIIHIEMGIDEPVRGPLPSNASSQAGLRIIYAGRITEIKGLHILIEAIKGISPELVSLDIYGQSSGPEYEGECKRKSEGISHVHWKGSLPAGSLVRHLPGYDILCLPSLAAEMAPLVIREAFAAGVPVLASDTPGNSEIVKNGINGWLFPSGNADFLRKKIIEIIEKPELLLAAKRGIVTPRPFHAVAMEHLELYKKLTASS